MNLQGALAEWDLLVNIFNPNMWVRMGIAGCVIWLYQFHWDLSELTEKQGIISRV